MTSNERYSQDPFAGLPDISPELVEIYSQQQHSFEADFRRLKERYPAVAHDLITGVQDVDSEELRIKRAFAQGALYMCGLFAAAVQTEHLRKLFETTGGDDDGASPPLSA